MCASKQKTDYQIVIKYRKKMKCGWTTETVYVLNKPVFSLTVSCWNSLVLWRLRPFVAPSSHFQPWFANRKGHVFWTVSTTPSADLLLSPAANLPSLSALSSVGRYRGPVRVWNSPPPRLEGEKVPQTELLIQSGEQYAQLGTHKGPEWVQGPCWGQAAQSPWGINCGWQCVNSGVNRQRRCGTPQARLNSPFHTLGSLLPLSLLLSHCIKKKKIPHITD